jgi:hypothetical protein
MMHSEDLSRLFAAERAVRPPLGAVEQGLSRLLPALAANTAPLPIAASALKLTWTAASKWILAGFVVGLLGSGAAASVWAPVGARPVQASVNVARTATPALVEGPPAVLDSAMGDSADGRTAEEPTSPVPQPSQRLAPAATPSAEPTRFDAELRLITSAKDEIDAGRPHLAKAWLAEHAARFPQGVFAPDRQALGVLIGCSERRDESAARRFAAEHPTSPMLERLRRACKMDASSSLPNEKPAATEPTHEEGGNR